jgi:hypothetical protein
MRVEKVRLKLCFPGVSYQYVLVCCLLLAFLVESGVFLSFFQKRQETCRKSQKTTHYDKKRLKSAQKDMKNTP